MYQTHWGLEKPPFSSGLDLNMFYEGASQREALARLRFLLSHRRRLGLVVGEAGVGKSLLLRVFAKQCRQAGAAVAKVDLLGLSPREFSWQLGNKLQAAVRVEDDIVRLLRQVNDRLEENSLQDKQTVVLLDDLDQAGPDLLSQVLRLIRSDATKLTLIATASWAQLQRVSKGLMELVDLRIDLESWDELDTTGYLQHALFEAGAQRPLFDEEAISDLYRFTKGVPRAVNRLADFALLAGSGNAAEVVCAVDIQAASEAVSLPSLV